MVKQAILISVFFTLLMIRPAFSQTDSIADSLSISISKTDKQLGQYLHTTLYYHGPLQLSTIDFLPWQERVAITIDDEYTDEDANGKKVQVVKLRLYPRQVGQYTLPSLTLGSEQSQPIDIHITSAIVDGAKITLNWTVSTISPWQRQGVLLQVQLQTSDASAHVKLDAPESEQFLSRVLKTERHVLADGRFQHEAAWLLHWIDVGEQTLELPPVRYQLSGSDQRKFYLPPLKLKVKALPNYLPPTLPIGKLKVSSEVVDVLGIKHWQLEIISDALMPYGVPELDKDLAEISEHDIANIKIKYSQQSNYSAYGDRSFYSAPMPQWLSPVGKDLRLSLRYFNSETGRLSTEEHNLPRRWSMPTWAWWLFAVLCLIASVYLAQILRPYVQAQMTRLILRKQLANAKNVKQMRKYILNSGSYITLSEWGKKDAIRKTVINDLNSYCFSGVGQVNLKRVKFDLLGCV